MSENAVPSFFRRLEKLRPLYDWTDKILMLIPCHFALVNPSVYATIDATSEKERDPHDPGESD